MTQGKYFGILVGREGEGWCQSPTSRVIAEIGTPRTPLTTKEHRGTLPPEPRSSAVEALLSAEHKKAPEGHPGAVLVWLAASS